MKLGSIDSNISLFKKGTTSGGSRAFFNFKNTLPLNLKFKKLMLKNKYNAGRNNTGKMVLNTRKTQSKNFPKPNLNTKFRTLRICFVANFIFIPKRNKLASLIILSCGSVTFLQTSTPHELFTLTRFKSVMRRK
jgi:hypothetical protein